MEDVKDILRKYSFTVSPSRPWLSHPPRSAAGYGQDVPRRSLTSAPDEAVTLTDPQAIRALAHPARLSVIDALYAGEVLTATECAERVGVSPSTMSYHLRALEKFGIVRRAASREDGRQRPWERAGSSLRVEMGGSADSASGLAATAFLVEESMRTDRERLMREAERAARTGDSKWFEATNYSRTRLLVTAEEARALIDRVDKLFGPYLEDARKRRPADAQSVIASVLIVRESTDGDVPS